jgi:hypothetical protein
VVADAVGETNLTKIFKPKQAFEDCQLFAIGNSVLILDGYATIAQPSYYCPKIGGSFPRHERCAFLRLWSPKSANSTAILPRGALPPDTIKSGFERQSVASGVQQ